LGQKIAPDKFITQNIACKSFVLSDIEIAVHHVTLVTLVTFSGTGDGR
jgi:hypothetical protein